MKFQRNHRSCMRIHYLNKFQNDKNFNEKDRMKMKCYIEKRTHNDSVS